MLIFIIANLINVIIQTVKSLVTIKSNKYVAAIVNALAYGFYTYIVVLMTGDLPLLQKCIVVGAVNLIGVFIVKLIEERKTKIKMWRIEATIKRIHQQALSDELTKINVGFSILYIRNSERVVILIYSPSKESSHKIKTILMKYDARYFVTEDKEL